MALKVLRSSVPAWIAASKKATPALWKTTNDGRVRVLQDRAVAPFNCRATNRLASSTNTVDTRRNSDFTCSRLLYIGVLLLKPILGKCCYPCLSCC